MDVDRDNFKKKMRKALGTSPSEVKDAPAAETYGVSFGEIDLPPARQRKSSYLSCRCTRKTEDTIQALMQKTGLSQSEIVNHLVEAALPALSEKYLG